MRLPNEPPSVRDNRLIGVGFAAGAKEGILLAVALTLELLSLGLATAAALHTAGTAHRRSIVIITGLALVPAISAILGTTLLAGMMGALLDAVLAFGVAALLYLVVEDLLTEAHAVPETPLITAVFFVGFLALLVISLSV